MSTLEEKVLYALERSVHHMGSLSVPEDITQVGISQKVGTDRAYISRILKRLEKAEFIVAELKHVSGMDRRVKAYFLTDKGKGELKKLKESKYGIDIPTVYSNRPVVKNFCGRNEELKRFREWTISESRIFVVKGIAGMGKTVFVSKALERFYTDTNIFWYKFLDSNSIKPLLTRISGFLLQIGRDRLSIYLRANVNIDINEVIFMLETELDGSNCILVFDDFQRCKDKEVIRFFGGLSDLLTRIHATRMVVIGRSVPRFHYDIQEVEKGAIVEMPLEGLDQKSATQLMSKNDIEPYAFKNLFKMTKGHPLALMLMSTKSQSDAMSFKAYFEDEVLSQLSPEERSVLYVASLFRTAVPEIIYLDIAMRSQLEWEAQRQVFDPKSATSSLPTELDFSVVHSLVGKSLMYPSSDAYEVHDIIRSLCITRMPPVMAQRYHHLISDHYLESHRNELSDLIEGLFHLNQAKEYHRVAQVSIDKGKHLISGGYLHEFLEILEGIDLDPLEDIDKARIFLMTSDIVIRMEDDEEAIRLLKMAESIFLKSDDKKGMAKVHLAMGHVMWKRSDHEKALEHYSPALELFKKEKDVANITDSYRLIGRALWRKGDLDEALKAFTSGLEYARKLHDDVVLADLYNNISGIQIYMGKLEMAKGYCDMSLKLIPKGTSNKLLRWRILNNLGAIYSKLDDHKNALKTHEEGLNYALSLSVVYHTIALMNSGESALLSGDVKKAEKYCQMAKELSQRLVEKDVVGYLHYVLAMIAVKKDERDDAESEFAITFDIANKTNSIYTLSIANRDYARFQMDIGNKDKAIAHYKISIDVFEKMKDHKEAEKVKAELARLSGE